MTQQIIQWITPAVENFRVAGYWIAFLAAILETVLGVGLLLPGSTVILFLGGLSARGYLDLGDLVWFAVLGAVIGDNINYLLGKTFGARWTRDGIWFLKREHFEKATAFFDRHGAKSVFWGRFIPSVKELVPFIAGLARMRQSTFMIWNVLGAIGWGLQWVLAGYLFAQSLYLAKVWLSRVGFLAGVVLAAIFAFSFIRWAVLGCGRQALAMSGSIVHFVRQAVVANPEVGNLVRRHGRFFDFMARRLDRNTFAGLPLTLLCASFVYILILFAGVIEDFLTGDPIVAADLRIASLLAAFRTPLLVRFFFWVTMLGKWQVVLAFSVAVSAVLWMGNRRHDVLALLATLAGSQVFAQLGKMAFHRPRPELPVYAEHSYSFPSGHAAVATAFYGFLAYVLIHRSANWKAKVNYFFAAILVVLLIGTSRLYLGVHYLSDVWSGYLIGALWLVIGIALSRYREESRYRDISSGTAWRGSRVLSVVTIVSAVVFYVGFAAFYHPKLLPPTGASGLVSIATPEDIFRKDGQRYTESLTGEKEVPINIVVFAKSDADMGRAFRASGWLAADEIGPVSIARVARAFLFGSGYPAEPVRPLFWGSRVSDFCFETSTGIEGMKARRAVRLWRTPFVDRDGYVAYVGQVALDGGLIRGLTHRISLDANSQRDWLWKSLDNTGVVSDRIRIQVADPASGRNALGDPFVTDGRADVLRVTPPDLVP